MDERLVVNLRVCFVNGLLVSGSHLRWFQFDCQLVEFAGEAKRRLVVLVLDARAGINADVEGLIDRHEGRDGMWDRLPSDFLTIHRKDTSAALGHARAGVFE